MWMERENKYYTLGEHFIRTKKRGPLQEMQELLLSKKNMHGLYPWKEELLMKCKKKTCLIGFRKPFHCKLNSECQQHFTKTEVNILYATPRPVKKSFASPYPNCTALF